jgi:hypothetical protein
VQRVILSGSYLIPVKSCHWTNFHQFSFRFGFQEVSTIKKDTGHPPKGKKKEIELGLGRGNPQNLYLRGLFILYTV